MKTFKIKYNSPKNIFQGEVFTKANKSSEAMEQFFEWLKEQATWIHLWEIHISIEEIENGKWI